MEMLLKNRFVSKFLKNAGCLIVTVFSLLCIFMLIPYEFKHTMQKFEQFLDY